MDRSLSGAHGQKEKEAVEDERWMPSRPQETPKNKNNTEVISMEKQIKIEQTAAEILEAALKEVNGRAYNWAFTDADELLYLAQAAEKEMDAINLRKDLRKGAVYVAYSGAPVASAYKYSRNGTRAVLLRRSRDWYLVDVCQVSLSTNSGGSTKLTLTEEAVEYLQGQITRRYA